MLQGHRNILLNTLIDGQFIMYKNTLKYFWLVTNVLYSLSYLEIVQVSKDDVLVKE